MPPAQLDCLAMDKSEDAFRTISEAAEDLDLPQHVLRFWETRFPQIRPLKRGGGRRYYRPDDVELLRVIRHLLYNDGYTIKGVQRMLKERGVRAVLAMPHERSQQPAPPAPLAETLMAGLDKAHASADAYATAAMLDQPAAEAGDVLAAHPAPYADARQAVAVHARPSPAFGPEQRRLLEAISGELSECRRILAAATI